jgi:hypothetical protein
MKWKKLCGNRTAHLFDDDSGVELVSLCGRARYDHLLLVPAKPTKTQLFCSYCRRLQAQLTPDDHKVVDLAEYRRRKMA